MQLLPAFTMPSPPIQAVYPTARHLAPKLRAFLDFLATELREVPARR
ncbi:MAG: hypothetical protein J0H54_10690 [Rhizobiales bacterium]|nr:hypothetical protein [Hyphomicrobiales bacterium]